MQLQEAEAPTPLESAFVEPQPLPVSRRRRRGRLCKCAERGIICKHGTTNNVNLLMEQSSSPA